MSKRLVVLEAVKALIVEAAPMAEVLGLDGGEAAARRTHPDGIIEVGAGDLGEPEAMLSPLTYLYDHTIPVEVVGTSEMAIDAIMTAIGLGVAANRTLGGLCDWLDVTAAATESLGATDERGNLAARPDRGGSFTIIASYSTPNPLA
ncbi:hypothetical protein [uncultured Sphingomonas sp.]|uniref:hypothetical protein n=1 Tax=uncultured Sphingomonas sp. TaxID=158754 RepID=UPI0025FF36FA|nr:hypothetical protein [uncultured Sphingomonas sp.]